MADKAKVLGCGAVLGLGGTDTDAETPTSPDPVAYIGREPAQILA